MNIKRNLICTCNILIVMILAWYMNGQTQNFTASSLIGHKILITGASSGIGEQLAYVYAKHGASIFVTARQESSLKKVIERCKQIGATTAVFGYYVGDMMNYRSESRRFVEAGYDFLGDIDTVIVNHLYMPQLTVWLGSEQDLHLFDDMMDVNVKSYVHIVSHTLPYLRRKKSKAGRIGVIGSTIGKIPNPIMAPYAASKFSLDGFFSSLRLELDQSESNITLTHAIIGPTNTSAFTEFLPRELHRLNVSKLSQAIDIPHSVPADVELVANKIMTSVESGIAEFYYPSLFTTDI